MASWATFLRLATDHLPLRQWGHILTNDFQKRNIHLSNVKT